MIKLLRTADFQNVIGLKADGALTNNVSFKLFDQGWGSHKLAPNSFKIVKKNCYTEVYGSSNPLIIYIYIFFIWTIIRV